MVVRIVGSLRIYRFSPTLAFRVWQRELTLYRRIWPSTILSTLFDPILYLLAIGFGLGAYVQSSVGSGDYARFLGPGLVASSVMMAAAYETSWNSYVRLFVEKSYEAMMATPAQLEDIVAGELAWAATRATIVGTIVLLVLLAFGLVGSPLAILVPIVALLGGFTFSVMGLCYTALARHMDQLTFLFTLGVTPMFLFSGVFFPVDQLHGPLFWIVQVSPLYHLVEIMRATIHGTLGAGILVHVATLLGIIAALWGLPAALIRRRIAN